MFNIDNDYMVKIRREIHMYPEVDYDLPKTVALIKRELESLGIPYTEEYGKGSVVGYINPDNKDFTIGIRADIDALRITEKTNLPFASKHEGMMHACGHDAHTAIVLGAAKTLKEMEKDLSCRIKLIFQPSEEGVTSGAVMMIENGVLDDVDILTGLHVGIHYPTGHVGICPGVSHASSRHFKIEVHGKSVHATAYQNGIDALSIAVRMYNAIETMTAREIGPAEKFVCVVTKLESGTAQNIIPNYAQMQGTIRTFTDELSEFIYERIQKIAKCLSEEYGVEISFHAPLKSSCLYNNPYLAELLKKSSEKALGEENVHEGSAVLGSDDFSRYTSIVPSVYFRLGIKNAEKGITKIAHENNFDIDEDALLVGAKTLVQFSLDNQNGIDMEKCRNQK